MGYFYLVLAIIAEVTATSALKASEQFSRLAPSAVVVIGYGTSFYFLAIVVRHIPLGVAYAIWSGMGIVLLTLVGVVFFRQIPEWQTVVGMAFIILGVVVVNIFSKTIAH